MPFDDTNNAFIYCLAEAAARFDIDVLLPVAMSNHYHAIVYDPKGMLPRFTEHFHKMLAKCQNAHWGRWENFWASEQVCVVHLVDYAAILDKLTYAATNPVKDRLVTKTQHWPGVNGLAAVLSGRPLTARRPHRFFRRTGTMPERATLHLTIPPELGDVAHLHAQLRDAVATLTPVRLLCTSSAGWPRWPRAPPFRRASSVPPPRDVTAEERAKAAASILQR